MSIVGRFGNAKLKKSSYMPVLKNGNEKVFLRNLKLTNMNFYLISIEK